MKGHRAKATALFATLFTIVYATVCTDSTARRHTEIKRHRAKATTIFSTLFITVCTTVFTTALLLSSLIEPRETPQHRRQKTKTKHSKLTL
jgi:hypothetical protein